MRRSLMVLTALCAFAPAVAQSRVCMGGNLDALSAADRRTCEDQVTRARQSAANAHAPADWHFVVVCGEDGWKDYMAFSTAGETALRNAAFDTDAVNKTTFLRGTQMLTPDSSDRIVAAAFRTQPNGIELAQK